MTHVVACHLSDCDPDKPKIGSMTHVVLSNEACYLSDCDPNKPKIGSMTHVVACCLSDCDPDKPKIGSMTHVVEESPYLSDPSSGKRLLTYLLTSSSSDPVSVKSKAEMLTMYLHGLGSHPDASIIEEAKRVIVQHNWIEFVKLYMDIYEFPKLTNSQKAKVFEKPDVELLGSMIKQEAHLFGVPLEASQMRWKSFVDYAQHQRNAIVQFIQNSNVVQSIIPELEKWTRTLTKTTTERASKKMFQSKIKNIYTEANSGKRFLSIDIRQAFATMVFQFLGRSCLGLQYLQATPIIAEQKLDLDNNFDWSNVMELFPDADCFKNSKWFRNLVTNFACLNVGILPLVELSMKFCIYDILKVMASIFPELSMVYVCQDEIVYELSWSDWNPTHPTPLVSTIRAGFKSADMQAQLHVLTRDWITDFLHVRAYQLVAKKINNRTYFIRDFGDSTDFKNLNPEDRLALEQREM